MDWKKLRQNAGKQLGKYKYALLILAVGLFLMSFPQKNVNQQDPVEPMVTVEQESLEERLGIILSKIQGVGDVQVLLTEACGQEFVFQTNGTSGTDGRIETVIISDGNRTESGLVRKVLPAVYQGAIVVCEGGGNASIRLSVMEAVSNVTGISASRITVLKMN